MKISTLFVLLATLSLSYAVGVTWTIAQLTPNPIMEGANGTTTQVDFSVTRSDPTGGVDIGVSTTSSNSSVSANLATDLTALNNFTISFLDTDASKNFSVFITGDAIYEFNETFYLVLSIDPLDTYTPLLVTIVNDDPAPVVSVISTPTVEGNSGGKPVALTFMMNRPSDLPCSVVWTTTAGTALAGLDFVPKNGTNVIAPGSLSSAGSVIILGDITDEPNEGFLITNLGSVNCSIAPGQQVIILDDDAPANLNITATASVLEGASGSISLLNFLMAVDVPSGFAIIVNYTVNSTTATPNVDYVAAGIPSGVVIPAGASQSNLWVRIIGDAFYENDEWIALQIVAVTNAGFTGPYTVNGTIINDDPLPAVSVVDVAYLEGDVNQARNVTISTGAGWTLSPITVSWTLQDGSALDGLDYVNQTGTTVITPGTGSAAATINTIIGDTIAEETNKTFSLIVTGVTCSACTTAKSTGIITIIDDDQPILYLSGSTVTESSTALLTFTVTIQAAQVSDITFDYAVTGGTATAGSDFTATSGSATITAGTKSTSVQVSVLDDNISEPTETVIFTISNVAGPARQNITTAIGYILDNPSDPIPTLYTYNITVIEGDNGTTLGYVPLTLSFGTARIVNVTYATRDESAYAPVDYLTTDGWVAFQPGTTDQNITVYIVGDKIEEPQTAFVVRLSAVTNANFGNYTAGVIISDDDALVTAAVQSDVYEGTPAFNPRFIGLIIVIGIVLIAIIASIVGFFALKRYVS